MKAEAEPYSHLRRSTLSIEWVITQSPRAELIDVAEIPGPTMVQPGMEDINIHWDGLGNRYVDSI
jgi:hypothetical protein